MQSAVIGQCRLCLVDGKELQDSHVLSKWTYKRIRGSGLNPNPVLLSNGRAVQTSEQVKERMLCSDCEQRFGVDESYVSGITYQQDGAAPLLDKVLRLHEMGPDGAVPAYTATLDWEKVLRFGTSVLWRSHWSAHAPSCSLGAEHAELFRRYLLDEIGFPEDAACVLIFVEDAAGHGSPVNLFCTLPVTTTQRDCDTHRLMVCGLQFEFATGAAIPDAYRRNCLARGNPRLMLLVTSDMTLDWIRPMFEGVKRLGSLARQK
jgi:hypothetical protein